MLGWVLILVVMMLATLGMKAGSLLDVLYKVRD